MVHSNMNWLQNIIQYASILTVNTYTYYLIIGRSKPCLHADNTVLLHCKFQEFWINPKRVILSPFDKHSVFILQAATESKYAWRSNGRFRPRLHYTGLLFIPDSFSLRSKKQGCLHYAASLCCQLMSFTVAMEISNIFCQYTIIY
jgi:hypothetical protein